MKSEFQFSNPELTNIEFISNSDFLDVNDGEVQMKIDLSVKVEKMQGMENEAKVSLRVCLGEQSDKYPFYLEAVECGFFRWETGKYKDDVVEKLLNQNAPSLLLSYLRPIIFQITAASSFEAYNLPFINFTSRKKISVI